MLAGRLLAFDETSHLLASEVVDDERYVTRLREDEFYDRPGVEGVWVVLRKRKGRWQLTGDFPHGGCRPQAPKDTAAKTPGKDVTGGIYGKRKDIKIRQAVIYLRPAVTIVGGAKDAGVTSPGEDVIGGIYGKRHA